MGHSNPTKGDGHDDHPVWKAGDAGRFGLQLFHLFLQFIDGRRIGVQPSIDFLADTRAKQQERHPQVGDENVHDEHDGKLIIEGVRDLLECRLIGAASNPAARNGAQSAPVGVRRITAQHPRIRLSHQPKSKRSPHDDACGGGEKHDNRLGS